MKLVILLLLSTVLFYGCATYPDLKETYFTTGYNFYKYADKGFLITSTGYDGKYSIMGVIDCSVIPEAKKEIFNENIGLLKTKDGTRYYYKYIGNDGFKVKTASTDSLITQMYKLALELNADAIINFQVYNDVIPGYGISVPRITGTAIKRKD